MWSPLGIRKGGNLSERGLTVDRLADGRQLDRSGADDQYRRLVNQARTEQAHGEDAGLGTDAGLRRRKYEAVYACRSFAEPLV